MAEAAASYEFFILEGLLLIGLIWYWLRLRKENAERRAKREADEAAKKEDK